MEEEFIPYEQAFALKELNFNKPCFGYYLCENSALGIDLKITTKWIDLLPYDSSSCKAPTYSQAFRWFREKYNMFSHLDKNVYNKYYYDIHNRGEIFFREEYSNTPEEAELACLKKLIEIVKTLPNEQ